MKKIPLVLFFIIICAIILATTTHAKISIERKFALGGQFTGGNSSVSSFHTDFYLNRNQKWINEVTLNGSFDYESTAGVDTMLKASLSLRRGHSLSKELYNYYKLEADHDRFQDIAVRIIPTIGIGYWFADEDTFKSMIEGALGYQREETLSQTSNDIILFNAISKLIIGNLSNTLNLYAAVNNLDNYRVINETNYRLKLTDEYNLKLTLKDEYNNQPAAGVLNNDVRFVVSLEFILNEKLEE